MPDRRRTLLRDVSQALVAAGAGSAAGALSIDRGVLPAWAAGALLGAALAAVRELALGRALAASVAAGAAAGGLALLPASLVGAESRFAVILLGGVPLGCLLAATREFSGAGEIEMPRGLVSQPAAIGGAVYLGALLVLSVALASALRFLRIDEGAGSFAGAAAGASAMLGVMAADRERLMLVRAHELRHGRSAEEP